MATKSILKNVDIKSKRLGKGFVSALELAKRRNGKQVQFSQNVDYLSKENVKDFFGDK